MKSTKGDWVRLDKAKFTADSNPVLNIDAGAAGPRFFLATGGDTENKNTRLGDQADLPDRERTPPEGLPIPKPEGKEK